MWGKGKATTPPPTAPPRVSAAILWLTSFILVCINWFCDCHFWFKRELALLLGLARYWLLECIFSAKQSDRSKIIYFTNKNSETEFSRRSTSLILATYHSIVGSIILYIFELTNDFESEITYKCYSCSFFSIMIVVVSKDSTPSSRLV